MKNIYTGWSGRGITEKFSAIFLLLLLLVVLVGGGGFFAFLYISRMAERIDQNNSIVQHVLDMDRGMERARRLHGDFFIHYQRIGLHAAHELYAQPSVREIARVITLSSKLKDLLVGEMPIHLDKIERADINLYLASAKRFAETSIEAVELISRRSAPERGVEDQLVQAGLAVRALVQGQPHLLAEVLDARSYYKDYLIERKRHLMQSSLNLLHSVETTVEQDDSLPVDLKQLLPVRIRTLEMLIGELLDIDLAIAARLNDFSLQVEAVAPVSRTLLEQTKKSAENAERQIKKANMIAGTGVFMGLVLAIGTLVYIARLVHTSITQNVIELARAAASFSEGQLDVRVREKSGDELGQLAAAYNDMAARLRDAIDNLETKVMNRTMDLSLSEERFRTLVNELPQVAVQGFAENREIIYWNRASELLFGYSAQEALGRKIEELIFPVSHRAGFQQSIERWQVEDVQLPAVEQLLLDKKGEEKPVFSAYAMQKNSLGEMTMYCVHVDLAELRRAESRGRVSESLYRQLFDQTMSGVAVYEAVDDGRDFVIKDYNKSGERIDQLKKEEIVGRFASEVFPSIGSLGLLEVFRSVWRTGEPGQLPASYYEDARMQGWRQNSVYKLPTGEIVSVFEDITPQKKAEEDKAAMELRLQRAQKMEAIGLMAGGIAHDLNNILSAIVGYPDLLLLQLAPDSQLRKPIKAIKGAGERAATVVADLLTVARGVASARTPADLNGLVKEYLDSPEFLQLQSSYPTVVFNTDLGNGVPVIECSPVHVLKCIMNLAVNGAEALTTSGTVSISTMAFRPDKRWKRQQGLDTPLFALLTISDDGTGISASDIDHIFEPFYTKKEMGKRSGSGLGLSVVWNTMKEHGGTVLVESSRKGTSFSLYFPASEKQIIDSEAVSLLQNARGTGEVILIVDDEPQQCELAVKMVEHLGYVAFCAGSGEEAVAYLKKNDADLLLLDMLMEPGISGRETFQRIKQFKPGQRAIIVSGFSENEDVQATIEMGAGGFVKKPYSLTILAKAIHGELGRG